MGCRHILLFPSSYPTSYAPVRGIFYREQAHALRECGERVGVVYPEHRRLRSFRPQDLGENHWQVTVRREEGLPTVRRHGWNAPFSWMRGELLRMQFRGLFSRYEQTFGRPDLLHSHGVFWGGYGARSVSRETGIPFVHTEHSTGYARGIFSSWEEGKIADVLFASATTVAVSKSLAELVGKTVPGGNVQVVPNMVATEFFTLPPTPRSSEPFTFLTVARLKKKKNVQGLLKAFRQAFAGQERVQLEIGGDGPREEVLQDLAVDLGIEEQVAFLGRLSRPEVRRRMWKANTFVLPSRVETFGVVVIEAMSTGLSVVTTRSGGPEEIVTDEAGWLTEPGDVEGLARCMRRAYEAREGLRKREKQIRDIVEQKYSREAVSEQLIEVYRAVLQDAEAMPERKKA